MVKVTNCLARIDRAGWSIAAHAQQEPYVNGFGDFGFQQLKGATPELWFSLTNRVVIANTLAELTPVAAKFGVGLALAIRIDLVPFSKLICCWSRGDNRADVIDPSDEQGIPASVRLGLLELGYKTLDALAPRVDGDSLTFYSYFMEAIKRGEFRHELVRYRVSLADFSVSNEQVNEFFDKG